MRGVSGHLLPTLLSTEPVDVNVIAVVNASFVRLAMRPPAVADVGGRWQHAVGATATIQGEHHGGTGGRLRTQLPLQGSTGLELLHTISAIASSRGGERNGQLQHGVKLRLLLPHMPHSNSSCSLRSSITAAVVTVPSVEAAIEVAVAVPMSVAVVCGCHTPATMAAMYRLRCLLVAVAAASCRTFIINA